MDYEKLIQERQQRIQQLISEIQRLEMCKKSLEEEVFRLEGELRLLSELMNKGKGNENSIIGNEDIR